MMEKVKFKKFSLLLSLTLICSCTLMKGKSRTGLKLVSQDIKLQPGMVTYASFVLPEDMSIPKLMCNDKELKYYEERGMGYVYITESYFSKIKPYDCFLTEGNYKEQVFRVSVSEYPYKEEKLRVNRKRVVLSKKDMKRVIREQKMLNRIYSNSSRRPYFDGPFKLPMKSYITSKFGTKRTFNNIKKGQHLGTDFRAAVGVPIPNSNRGKVVFAGDLFYTGNTVIVDHGMSIFTVYAHMSKISAEEGQMVDTLDILGLAGMTGRVSGPHLHWGVKVQGDRVSGFSLIEASEKQFNLK
jgi:murein DD-endopeptidase MepM/ murein hydrolase activator NlpD